MAAEGASALASDFGGLSLHGRTFVEYLFLGGTALDLRCKTKVLSRTVTRLADVPWAAVDGACTGQVNTPGCSVVYLKPRAMFRDPFRSREGADAYLVLCDTFSPPSCLEAVDSPDPPGAVAGIEWDPHPSNNRAFCEQVMEAAAVFDPWFSCEQQYALLDSKSCLPLGTQDTPSTSVSQLQPSSSVGGGGYCGLGTGQAKAREFAEAHMMACLHAGLKVTGMHASAAPGRWSYELGTLRGLDFADQLWVSRYILLKLAEKHGLVASLDPAVGAGSGCGRPAAWQPTPSAAVAPGGEDGGVGVLVRLSTSETREDGRGWQFIQQHVRRLEATHAQHMLVYGTGNTQRMLCPGSASALGRFSVGVESTAASIRVPHSTVLERKGYYEDRRPAGNMDPYLVSLMLVCTTCALPLPTRVGASAAPRSQQVQHPDAHAPCWGGQLPRHTSAQPAGSAAYSSCARPVVNRRQVQQEAQSRPWGAGAHGLGGPAASGGASASSSAILSELDVQQQQQLLRGRQQQQLLAAGWLMPDTPDQQVGLLAEAVPGAGH